MNHDGIPERVPEESQKKSRKKEFLEKSFRNAGRLPEKIKGKILNGNPGRIDAEFAGEINERISERIQQKCLRE